MTDLKNFKFFQIGLGSMGKRRIRNLLHHGIKAKQIVGFDTNPERIKEAVKLHDITPVKGFTEGVKSFHPDVFIISTPPNTHWKYFLPAAKAKKHFFAEHPTTDQGYAELKKLMDGTFVGAPSCTLRFNSAIKEIEKQIEKETIGSVLSFQYHLGQYLPDWHPWEDFRQVYFSKKTTGACREMFAFELLWLTHALNLPEIKQIRGVTKKLSDLEMTADDFYSYIAQFKNGVMGTVVIDLLSRAPFRTLRVIGMKGVLDWEWQKYEIRILKPNTKTELIYLTKGRQEKNYVATEDMYEEEIGAFLTAIQGKRRYPFTFEENQKHLKAMLALEKSSKAGKVVDVASSDA